METSVTEIIFWIGLSLLLYTYIGYGLLVQLLTQFTKPTITVAEEWPAITFLVAAYNEVDVIEEKIKNTLALTYPGILKIWIVTDGSDDGTPELVTKYPNVKLFHLPERRGKLHAANRVMKLVDTAVTVFSDANTLLNVNALQLLARHFSNPTVGGVSGEKRIVEKSSDTASGSGEGLYWRYESWLKRKDSDLHSIQGAAGELFAIRTVLYEAPGPDTIIEDFFISMSIVARGFRFVYEHDAFAMETGSASVSDEWARKVRISAGGLQAIVKFSFLLNPFSYGTTSFQFLSHRVLRWTVAPISLPIVLALNMRLAGLSIFYEILLVTQGLFYGSALVGYAIRNMKLKVRVLFIPLFFTMMNIAVYAGFLRLIRGKQSAVWKKVNRAPAVN